MTDMQTVEIKHRQTGAVLFSASVGGATANIRLGAAVKLALNAGADLGNANLSGADLRGADLSGADLSGANLRGANLRGADLRGADLVGAYLSGANLSGAYLRGADLFGADLFGANLSGADLGGANLSYADLSDAYLRGANLRNAVLGNANLSGAYLRGANLFGADLSGANLRGANLRGADLRDAPTIPDIHKAVYAAASQPKALDMSEWHTCATTHCRAGWVVTLAGKEGTELEAEIGTPAAAAAIYLASDPERWKTERLPSFYSSNSAALADMKRLAEATS